MVAAIIILTLLVSIEFISDIVIKKWTLGEVPGWALIPTFVIFLGAFFLWIWAMKVESFSKVVIFYALLSVIGGSVFGYLFFQEKMSAINILGVFLALISILLTASPR